MQMQLKVTKADGSVEEYLHTKIIGTISNALADSGQADMCIAEGLAEAVTYFLYHGEKSARVSSGEIFSMIKAVLTATSHEEAAIVLSEHRYERKLKRCRLEVVSIDIQQFEDAKILAEAENSGRRSPWNKSRIVTDLVTKYNLSRPTARTIAALVEEKIFGVQISLVPVSLIKQLVLGETAKVLRAQRQLQTV